MEVKYRLWSVLCWKYIKIKIIIPLPGCGNYIPMLIFCSCVFLPIRYAYMAAGMKVKSIPLTEPIVHLATRGGGDAGAKWKRKLIFTNQVAAISEPGIESLYIPLILPFIECGADNFIPVCSHIDQPINNSTDYVKVIQPLFLFLGSQCTRFSFCKF